MTRLAIIAAILAALSCGAGDPPTLEGGCACQAQIDAVALACLEAIAALDAEVTRRDALVKAEVERQLFDLAARVDTLQEATHAAP